MKLFPGYFFRNIGFFSISGSNASKTTLAKLKQTLPSANNRYLTSKKVIVGDGFKVRSKMSLKTFFYTILLYYTTNEVFKFQKVFFKD